MTDPRSEIQTCAEWRGPGLALYELEGGGTRHRWHCLDCDEKGPAEVDGRRCRDQFVHHVGTRHGAGLGG